MVKSRTELVCVNHLCHLSTLQTGIKVMGSNYQQCFYLAIQIAKIFLQTVTPMLFPLGIDLIPQYSPPSALGGFPPWLPMVFYKSTSSAFFLPLVQWHVFEKQLARVRVLF